MGEEDAAPNPSGRSARQPIRPSWRDRPPPGASVAGADRDQHLPGPSLGTVAVAHKPRESGQSWDNSHRRFRATSTQEPARRGASCLHRSRLGIHSRLGANLSGPRCAAHQWATSSISWPTSPTISCTLRTSGRRCAAGDTCLRAGTSGRFGSCVHLSDNRGVPGSSPGLATGEPRCHPSLLVSGVRSRRDALGHGLGHGPHCVLKAESQNLDNGAQSGAHSD